MIQNNKSRPQGLDLISRGRPQVAARNVTDSHYLATLKIPVLRGRGFLDSDTETTAPVALVNQAFVQEYFPEDDPIGKQLRISVAQQLDTAHSGDEVFTIIGMVGNTMSRGPALPAMPHFLGRA